MKIDLLDVKISKTRAEMGWTAATDIKACILELLEQKDYINMIFAAAPSQNEVLATLVADSDIPWERIKINIDYALRNDYFFECSIVKTIIPNTL